SAVVVFDVRSGERLYTVRESTPLKPASVLKVVTALVALEEYTPFHTFKTEVRGSGLRGSSVDTLYLKGYGDPSLTQEDLWGIARKVYLRGVRSIGKVVVDDSAFVDASERSGPRSYQAGASALSFNYNSITFEVCPISGKSTAAVTHDPREFPVSYDGAVTVSNGKSSTYRIDEKRGGAPVPLQVQLGGVLYRRAGCQQVHRSIPDPALYAGYTFKGLLEKEGIQVGGAVARGVAAPKAAIIHTHRSKPLIEVIRLLNLYSNNMIAEQLVMLLGRVTDSRFERKMGLQRISEFLVRRGVSKAEFSIHDGSGLSHDNRLSADALAVALREALTREDLSVEFASSLPVDGKSGTLRKRSYPGVTRAKTGTLNGVMSLAGSVQNSRGRALGFVILQNKVSSRDKGSRLEKQVISVLRESTV
ncbi:MAG: D-alanyl-D-alanine carboxypeptidase/D-alanyl-D-alanine-endopeptidase, partial [Bdellovibrionales bacterium]|nr:D-alanyl-D-alanine carboxypeptidase/D-alanyl-D-alanine-endopeptidase [Bdellovibrionales bacterium]